MQILTILRSRISRMFVLCFSSFFFRSSSMIYQFDLLFICRSVVACLILLYILLLLSTALICSSPFVFSLLLFHLSPLAPLRDFTYSFPSVLSLPFDSSSWLFHFNVLPTFYPTYVPQTHPYISLVCFPLIPSYHVCTFQVGGPPLYPWDIWNISPSPPMSLAPSHSLAIYNLNNIWLAAWLLGLLFLCFP